MKAILFLPTQGPHLPRPGDEEDFDWRVQCRLAAALHKTLPESFIYVASAFQQSGACSELEFYGEELLAEGVPVDALWVYPRGLETVEQCELALDLAARAHARLIAISCAVHFKRVRYLLQAGTVEHVIAYGTPNRWLHFTHIVLGIVFPVLDTLGLRGWWKQRIAQRRQSGKQ